jgi:hypothetical protein
VFLDALGVPFNKLTSPDAYPLWSEFSGLPRTYIQICELDILRDDAVCYVRGLRDAGVEVRETLYKVCGFFLATSFSESEIISLGTAPYILDLLPSFRPFNDGARGLRAGIEVALGNLSMND